MTTLKFLARMIVLSLLGVAVACSAPVEEDADNQTGAVSAEPTTSSVPFRAPGLYQLTSASGLLSVINLMPDGTVNGVMGGTLGASFSGTYRVDDPRNGSLYRIFILTVKGTNGASLKGLSGSVTFKVTPIEGKKYDYTFDSNDSPSFTMKLTDAPWLDTHDAAYDAGHAK